MTNMAKTKTIELVPGRWFTPAQVKGLVAEARDAGWNCFRDANGNSYLAKEDKNGFHRQNSNIVRDPDLALACTALRLRGDADTE